MNIHEQSSAGSLVDLQVVDLTPRFLDFYTRASVEGVDAEQRWELWEKHYGLSGTTPDERGRQKARQLLDEVWPRYPEIMALVRQGTGDIEPEARAILEWVARTLECTRPVHAKLSIYVGMFNNAAFAYTDNGVQNVMVPLEMDEALREQILTHEFTHAVHNTVAGLSGAWQHSFAEQVMMEGMTTRVVAYAYPELPVPKAIYPVEGDWYERCEREQGRILRFVQEHLREDCSPVLSQPGVEEYYYAGWVVVGELLRQGLSLAGVAHIVAEDVPERVEGAISALLG